MKHSIIFSADGSNTLKLTEFDECYHSSNGAYNEAKHIYIDCGVEFLWKKSPLNTIIIYDIGLGTALNCMATLAWQENLAKEGIPVPKICYNGIEKYPIPQYEALLLNFPEHIAKHNPNIPIELLKEWFYIIHTSPWEENVPINNHFSLNKHRGDLAFVPGEYFTNNQPQSLTVIMYDTFSPQTQPQLWDAEIFQKIAGNVSNETVLTTYCSKGTVKQALRDAGFTLERLQGPIGKRHILRAILLK